MNFSNSILSKSEKTKFQGIYKKQTKKGLAYIARYTVNKSTKTQIIGYSSDGLTEYDAFKQRLDLIASSKLAHVLSNEREQEYLIPKLFQDFMNFRKPFLAKNTIDNYASIFNRYINSDYKNTDIRNVTYNDLQKYINNLLEHKRPATVEKIVSALKKFYLYLQSNGIYKYNPAINIILPKYDNKKYFSMPMKDVKRLVEYIKNIDSQMYKTIYMLLLHGRRCYETLTLSWSNIDFTAKIYHLDYRKTKTRKNQFFYLEEFQLIELKKLRALYPSSTYVFENPRTKKPLTYTSLFRIHKTLRKDLSLPDFKLHSLRHLIGFLLVNNGYSLEITAKILGHSSINSTQRYAVLEMDKAKKAYSKTINKIF